MFKKLIYSFGYALKGLAATFKTEQNFRIHTLAVLVVVATGIYFDITPTQWAIQLIVCGMVLTAELLNTASEKLIDKLHPQHDPIIGKIKDTLAAAVLVCAITSVVIALIIYYPYVVKLL